MTDKLDQQSKLPEHSDIQPIIFPTIKELGIGEKTKLGLFLEEKGVKDALDLLAKGGLSRLEGLPRLSHSRLRRLEAQTQLSILPTDVKTNDLLIERKYLDPLEIARRSPTEFIDSVKGVIEPDKAKVIHTAANTSRKLISNFAVEQSLNASTVNQVSSIFTSSCDCEDCRSAVSPGAYLADLLDYALTHLRIHFPGFPNPESITLDFLTNLLFQQFGDLPISCEAMEDEVRQVRLCIEVLRKYLDEPTGVSLSGAVPFTIQSVFAGDVDGDGCDELVALIDWSVTVTDSNPESNALYIMDYDAAGKYWRHLSPLPGNVHGADVVCGPYPYRTKFGFAADVDGDQIDEIVLGIARDGEQLNEFWVMKYEAATHTWRHFSPISGHPFQADIDCSIANVGMRFAAAADVDGDQRDEIVVALDGPGPQGRLFWVMDYDPAGTQWRHLSPIPNHPLNADLDPLPDQPNEVTFARFMVVGNFDGDGSAELAISQEHPTLDNYKRRFWFMKYGSAGWTHLHGELAPDLTYDYLITDQYGARFGIAVDVDGDGHDELVIALEPTLGGGVPTDTNKLYSLGYRIDGFGKPYWLSTSSIDCSNKPIPAQAAIAVDSDGIGRKEIAVLPESEPPGTGLWIMRRGASKWEHQSQIASHPQDADLDWGKAVYRAAEILPADVDGDGKDEIVIYPTLQRGLWVMKYDGTAWNYMSEAANLAADEENYRLAAYQELLSSIGTSFDEIRLATVASDDARQALAQRIEIDLETTRPDKLDELYLRSATPTTPATLTEQRLEALFGLPDTNRDPQLARQPSKLEMWRLSHLRTRWRAQDWTLDAYSSQLLPIIDPDVVTPDDFRQPTAKADVADPDSPFDLWIKRRNWIDERLENFRAIRHTVRNQNIPNMEAMLSAMYNNIAYSGTTLPTWTQPKIAELDRLIKEIRGGNRETAKNAAKTIQEQLHLPIDAFACLMDIRDKAMRWERGLSNDAISPSEWDEVYSILVQAQKSIFFAPWCTEEKDWNDKNKTELFGARYFSPPAREPLEGEWSDDIPYPRIDPETTSLNDLWEAARRDYALYPNLPKRDLALKYWQSRQNTLVNDRQNLQTVYEANNDPLASFNVLLQQVLGDTAGNLPVNLDLLKNALDSGDEQEVRDAKEEIQNKLFMSEDDFNRLMVMRQKLNRKQEATPADVDGVLTILTSVKKLKQHYPVWINEEQDAVSGLWYWQALKAQLPRWRATQEVRQGWLQALADRSRPPIIDPSVVGEDSLSSSGAITIWRARKKMLSDHIEALAKIPKTLAGLDAMLKSEIGIDEITLAALANLRDNGGSVSGHLTRLGLNGAAFIDLARFRELVAANQEILPTEWNSIYTILTQVWKQREYSDWREKEKEAAIILSSDYFQIPKTTPMFPPISPPEPPQWDLTLRHQRDWYHTLQSRIDEEVNTRDTLRAIVSETEERTLGRLRDALVRASSAEGVTLVDKAKWLSARLLIDMQRDTCQVTTRLGQAIETILNLLWLARMNQLDKLGVRFMLDAPDFDEELRWIGSYASWRSAMFVDLYNENLLAPNLRRHQTSAFRTLVKSLQSGRRMTPARARQLANVYMSYVREVSTLEVKVCTTAVTRKAEDSKLDILTYLFAISQNGKVYWATRNPRGTPGYQQSFWEELGGFEQVDELIGAVPYNNPRSQRRLLLFARTREDQKSAMAFLSYDLDTLMWDTQSTPLDLPDKTTGFTAKMQNTNEHMPPYLAFWLENGGIWGRRLNVMGTGWADGEFDPLYTQLAPISWEQPRLIDTVTYLDDSGMADVTVIDLDGSGRPCLVFLTVDQVPGTGLTSARYDIAANVSTAGISVDWKPHIIPVHLPRSAAGIASARIDDNEQPELILLSIFSVSTNALSNIGYYQIGWNLNTDGEATGWDKLYPVQVPAECVGKPIQGCGIAIADIDGNGRPDMVVFLVFHSEGQNKGCYWIGWNLQLDGTVQSWSEAQEVPGWFGTSAQGAGIAVADVNGNGRLDLIVFHIDNPDNAIQGYENHGYYRIGWSLDKAGKATTWSDAHPIPDWFGAENLEGGIAVVDLEGNGLSELIVYHIDNPTGANTGHYRIGRNIDGRWNQPWRVDCANSVHDFKPIFHSYDISETVTSQELQVRRTQIQNMFDENFLLDTNYRRTHLTYLDETFYFVPIALALQLQRSGEYVAALDWFRTVYDYTQDENLRKIFYGLRLEETLSPDISERAANWLLDPLNPHAIAMTRRNSYTRFTTLMLTDCLLDYADSEFTLDTPESVPRAALLYKMGLELLDAKVLNPPCLDTPATPASVGITLAGVLGKRMQDFQIERENLLRTHLIGSALSKIIALSGAASIGFVPNPAFNFCVAPNPLLQALRLRAELNLYKINNCRNIAGMERELEPYSAATDSVSGLPMIGSGGQLILPGMVTFRPTPYRYVVLIERAKTLVNLAQQVESAFLSALEKRDAEAYNLMRARQDLRLAQAGIRLQDLRVKEAEGGVKLAELQKERSQIQFDTYSEWVNQGLLAAEETLLEMYDAYATFEQTAILANATAQAIANLGAASFAYLATGAAQFLAAGRRNMLEKQNIYVSLERRKQEAELSRNIAQQDMVISDQQITMAQDHVRVVGQEREIAQMQSEIAHTNVDYLANKFTNVELYEWMTDRLERIYVDLLQKGASIARLAWAELAFARQQILPVNIQLDYTKVSDNLLLDNSASVDRRGLTGSAQLLHDIYQLDQYAFETDQRKLQLSKTISLAQLDPAAFQRLRETGVMLFATPMEMFDRDFPGHYLRLIHKVRVSVVALIPPTQGIRATLSTSGLSRVVTSGDVFQTVTLRRGPQIIAFTSPTNATGLFELDPQSEMLMPFEGSGVATNWEFRLPKAANLFDYQTLADVLLTIDYTALNSFDYQGQVIQSFPTSMKLDQPFSLRNRFPDQWYDLHNSELQEAAQGLSVRLSIVREDFPPNLENIRIQRVSILITPQNITGVRQLKLYFTEYTNRGRLGGEAQPNSGVASWTAMNTRSPFGEWEFSLSNTEELRSQFKNGEISDILLIVSYSADSPVWR